VNGEHKLTLTDPLLIKKAHTATATLPANLCPGGDGLYVKTADNSFYRTVCDSDINVGENTFQVFTNTAEECAE
jgi:hypothetical protein